MKLIRKQWLTFYQRVLGGLLVMLGFSGCDGKGMHLRDNDGKLMLCRLNELA